MHSFMVLNSRYLLGHEYVTSRISERSIWVLYSGKVVRVRCINLTDKIDHGKLIRLHICTTTASPVGMQLQNRRSPLRFEYFAEPRGRDLYVRWYIDMDDECLPIRPVSIDIVCQSRYFSGQQLIEALFWPQCSVSEVW